MSMNRFLKDLSPSTLRFATGLLLLTNLFTIGWYVYRSPMTPHEFAAAYPYIDLSRNFIPQEHFIVNLQPLREKLEALTAAFDGGTVSLYLEFLNTGSYISLNPETYIYPASLTKMVAAMAAMNKVDRGEWKLSDTLPLKEEDRDTHSNNRSDPLSDYPPGTAVSLERLLIDLLVYSDNTAHNVLLRNLTIPDIADVGANVGLIELANQDGKYLTREYARIFRSLYTSSYLTRESSERILQWLDEAVFNDFLARPIPPEVPFAHKYGQNDIVQTYSDAGIVYVPNRPYLIVVMVEGKGQPETSLIKAAAYMQAVSKAAYEFFAEGQAQ